LYKIAVEKNWKLILPNSEMIQKAATTEKERYIGYYSNNIKLFNLVQDPKESTNLAAEYPVEVERLTAALNNWW